METQRPPVAVTVSTGVLTPFELAQLSDADRAAIERTCQRLLAQYGQAWLTRERGRLRDELSFAYGVP